MAAERAKPARTSGDQAVARFLALHPFRRRAIERAIEADVLTLAEIAREFNNSFEAVRGGAILIRGSKRKTGS